MAKWPDFANVFFQIFRLPPYSLDPPLNNSEPKAQVRLLKFPEENSIYWKSRIVKIILSFFQMGTNAFREEAIADHKVEDY